jgi:hypothetical protein
MNSTCPLVPGTTTAVSRFHLSIRSERPLLADGPSKGRSCWIAVNMAVKIGVRSVGLRARAGSDERRSPNRKRVIVTSRFKRTFRSLGS